MTDSVFTSRLFHFSYDEEADRVNQYQRLSLEGLEKIEIGRFVCAFYLELNEEQFFTYFIMIFILLTFL